MCLAFNGYINFCQEHQPLYYGISAFSTPNYQSRIHCFMLDAVNLVCACMIALAVEQAGRELTSRPVGQYFAAETTEE